MGNKDTLRCIHGLTKDHVVGGGGTRCIGPFQWAMTVEEAKSVGYYYTEYGKTYNRISK